MCKVLLEVQADVFCGQEINLDVNKPQVKSIMFETTRQLWQRSRLTLGTTPLDSKTMYKPGGTLLLTLANATGRIIKQHSDKWGRWVSQVFQGGLNRQIVIVSAYQPVTDKVQAGQITVAAQHYNLLTSSQDKLTSPRAAFCRDLLLYLKECASHGYQIVLVGDFNEVLGSEPDGLVKIMNALSLIDLMSGKHSQTRPATYARGIKCLDHILVSQDLLPAASACGYEPFNHRHPSDHRAYYVDFHIDQLFGAQIPQLSKYEPRMLQSTNIRQVTEYIQFKYDSLSRANLFHRAEKLQKAGDRDQFAERLDKDLLAISLAAENHITKFAAPHWSLELHNARYRVQLLKKYLSSLRTRLPVSPQSLRDLTEILQPDQIPCDIPRCQQYLRQAKLNVNQIVAQSYERRDTERKHKLQILNSSTSPKDRATATTLKALQKIETIRQVWSKLQSVRRTSDRTGVIRIEIPIHPNTDPKTCTEWKLIDVPSEVLARLQDRNRRHFGQAHGTPFTLPPLKQDLGYCGNTKSADNILSGTYRYPDTGDTSMQDFLDHLQHTTDIANFDSTPTITATAFREKLKVWRESTTTSPSGLHLGHYKAMIARHKFSEVTGDDPVELQRQRDDLNQKQLAIFSVHLTMINYALSRGYSFKRWQTVANTMLFKEPGNIKIHRTRVIHIYEADYNLAMGLKWREAMYRAEALQLLHSGQFGSRPHRTATDPVLLEELQFEISRITRKTLIQTNYDATSCYDRIIPNLAMIVSRKYGIHPQVAQSNATTLHKAEYRIRTDLGLAPTGYSHTPHLPVYGTGQGSGNSPAIWCFLSSTLYDCYDQSASKAFYCTPNGKHPVGIGMIGFVDDSNGQTNQFLSDEAVDTPEVILSQMQRNAQRWSDMLGISGGALELSKCSYHVLTWKFTKQGDPVLYPDRAKYSNVHVRDNNTGQDQALEYLSSPFAAHKTLGHFKDPAGNQKEQQRQLQKKSDEVVSFLWKCPLTREESWIFYYSCYVPSMSYPLANSHFTNQQLTKIQRKAMSIIIARCGFNRHMHRAIVFGPREYGGAGFKRLYDQQGIGQITTVLKHWRANTDAGKLLRNAVSWGNYSVGMSKSFLEDVDTPLPHLESKWLKSLRQYLKDVNCRLDIDDPGIAPLEREHDCYIMEAIIQSKQFTAAQLRRLNHCRIFLNAITLSDLTTVVGDHLDMEKIRGQTSLFSLGSRWMKIHQESPSALEWRLWKKANKLWSTSAGKLIQPLGSWLQTHSHRRITAIAYQYDMFLAICKGGNEYITCEHIGRRRYTEHATDTISYENLPEHARPVDVIMEDASCWRIVATTKAPTSKRPFNYGTFDEYVSTLEPWETDLLQHHELFIDPYSACLELQPRFFAGSDGSEKYGTHGAFGWTISTIQGERVASGMGPSRGSRMDSYRAECSGVLSILRFLIQIATFTAMHEPWQGVIGTDSKSLLDKLSPNPTSSDTNQEAGKQVHLDELTPEWDLLIEIQEGLRLLPGVSLTHVKGHQDDSQPYDRLSLLAQLNVDADKMATAFQTKHGLARPIALMTPNTGIHLVHSTGTITGKYEDRIRLISTSPALVSKIQTKYHWSDSTMRMVHWKAHGKAIKVHHTRRRVHLSKLIHDCLPTHELLNKFDSGKRTCSLCQHHCEDRDHIIRCPHSSRETWRLSFLQSLNTFHSTMHTSPILRHVLNKAFAQWLDPQQPDEINPVLFHTNVGKLIRQQNLIGWRQLFNGRFSVEWARIQEDYYQNHRNHTKFRRTGIQWQQRLIVTIWTQWEVVWKQRNGDVHGHNMTEKHAAERVAVASQLREIYDTRQHMEPSIQRMLHTDVRTHLQTPNWVTRNWISMHGQLFKDSIRRVKEKSIQGVRSIRSYFHPVP